MKGEAVIDFEDHFVDWINGLVKGENSCVQMPKEQLEENYALAYSLYRNHQYREADIFFRLLVAAAPFEQKFWKGLGACLQMKKNYEEALNCYMSAQMFNRETPDPYLYVYSADCYFALKQINEGLKALEAAHVNAEKTKDARILRHIALMRELWSKQ